MEKRFVMFEIAVEVEDGKDIKEIADNLEIMENGKRVNFEIENYYEFNA